MGFKCMRGLGGGDVRPIQTLSCVSHACDPILHAVKPTSPLPPPLALGLQAGLAKHLNQILQPVRDHFENNAEVRARCGTRGSARWLRQQLICVLVQCAPGCLLSAGRARVRCARCTAPVQAVSVFIVPGLSFCFVHASSRRALRVGLPFQ